MSRATSSTRTHLCFHGIGELRHEREPGEGDYWVRPDLFRRVLDHVVGRDGVELSFDDGNPSDLEIALPELQERALAATFFPIAGRLDGAGSLAGEDVRTLARSGMRIGSHGMAHRSWRGMDPADQEVEFGHAREIIATVVGRPVDVAACPLGEYDRSALAGLRARGYSHVYTSDRTQARTGVWLQPRFSIRASDDLASVREVLDGGDGIWKRQIARARILAKSAR